jgi:SpoVK/Ycf46/Vps4 family AAA+-type ATPase
MRDLKARKSGKNQAINQSVRVTREEKLESKGAEKKNYQDMTQNMKKEHQRLKRRLEVVGDPNYSLTLRKKIMDIKDQIQTLEEVKRKMTNDKFVRERRMNKVIMAGQNDAMVETQERVKELTVLFDRVHKINKKLK